MPDYKKMLENIHHKKSLSDLSFLVTGGAGFIGSNLVEYLIKNGAKKVKVLDNLSNGYYKNIQEFIGNPAFEFIEGDIRDLETCKLACEDINYVSHQAALGSVPRSINDPITSNDVNVSGFLNMLVAVKESNVKRMVYAASSSTYGDSRNLPKVENVIGNPLSPYAVTKYVNELYADVFGKLYGIETIGLRYFNVFGPKQNQNGAYAAVIPLFIDAVLNEQPANINGNGEQTRDFTYVSNAIQANIKAMLIDSKGAVNQVYNVAAGDKTSLNTLWDILCSIAETKLSVNYGPARLGDVMDSLADISKAFTLLGYKPSHDINRGLIETFKWYKNNYGYTV